MTHVKKTNFRWAIVALLFFATTINYFDRLRSDGWRGINMNHFPEQGWQILDDPNHPWMLQGKMQPCDSFAVASACELHAASRSFRHVRRKKACIVACSATPPH